MTLAAIRIARVSFLALLLFPIGAQAFSKSEIVYTIEPIIGYERVRKSAPTPHSIDRLMYGARGSAGWRWLSAELEFTRATDSETFPLQPLNIRDTDEKLKLGLRGTYQLTGILSTSVRGGIQATRNTHEETTLGATTRTVSNPVYDPYAGLGFSAGLSRNFALNAGLTVVFGEFPDMSKNEYQTSFGVNVSLP